MYFNNIIGGSAAFLAGLELYIALNTSNEELGMFTTALAALLIFVSIRSLVEIHASLRNKT